MTAKVLLHDPKDKPSMLERAFKISPGFVTQVAFTLTYVSNIPLYDDSRYSTEFKV